MLENLNNPNNKFIRYQYSETRLEPIWECLVSILKDPENVIPRLEEYTFKNSNSEKAKEKIVQCQKQIDIIKGQRSRVSTAFMYQGIPEKEYKNNLNECNKKIEELENQKTKLEQTLVVGKERKDRGIVLEKLYRQVKARLENLDYEDKQHILRLFIERINLFHKKNYAEVFFRFPVVTRFSDGELVKSVLKEDSMKLVLHVKTLSEQERRREVFILNKGMCK